MPVHRSIGDLRNAAHGGKSRDCEPGSWVQIVMGNPPRRIETFRQRQRFVGTTNHDGDILGGRAATHLVVHRHFKQIFAGRIVGTGAESHQLTGEKDHTGESLPA